MSFPPNLSQTTVTRSVLVDFQLLPPSAPERLYSPLVRDKPRKPWAEQLLQGLELVSTTEVKAMCRMGDEK